MDQNHLTVLEIWKPACTPCGSSMLSFIMCSDVWSKIPMERWLEHYRTAAVEFFFIKTESVLATLRGFRQQFQRRDILAAILHYCRYRSGVKKDQWRAISQKNIHVLLLHPTNVQRVRDSILRSRTGHFSGRFSHIASRTAALAE